MGGYVFYYVKDWNVYLLEYVDVFVSVEQGNVLWCGDNYGVIYDEFLIEGYLYIVGIGW